MKIGKGEVALVCSIQEAQLLKKWLGAMSKNKYKAIGLNEKDCSAMSGMYDQLVHYFEDIK